MPEPRATVVLVHGAWHGPWCWEYLTPLLRSSALAVHLVELPSVTSPVPVGLGADVRYLSDEISAIKGPVILCGHSYGGTVVAAAATEQADVRHLVYVSAYLAAEGESVATSLAASGERRPGHWIRRRPDGLTEVDPERAATLFYGECPSATQSWAVRKLRPQWGLTLTEPLRAAAGCPHPSTYVVCSEDRALAPRIQREVYAVRAREIVTLASGHSPFLSRPLELAQVLTGIAG